MELMQQDPLLQRVLRLQASTVPVVNFVSKEAGPNMSEETLKKLTQIVLYSTQLTAKISTHFGIDSDQMITWLDEILPSYMEADPFELMVQAPEEVAAVVEAAKARGIGS